MALLSTPGSWLYVDPDDPRHRVVTPEDTRAIALNGDARMREQAGAIRTALRQLHRDVEIVQERVDKLNTHFGQARADLEGISTAAERAGKRAARLDAFDFEELAPARDEPVLPR